MVGKYLFERDVLFENGDLSLLQSSTYFSRDVVMSLSFGIFKNFKKVIIFTKFSFKLKNFLAH